MAQNILDTNITIPIKRTSPYVFKDSDTGVYYPNINAGYGPYNSESDARTALTNLFGDDIPDGVLVTILDSTSYMKLYLFYDAQFHEIGSGKGGTDATVNVQSLYVVTSTNWTVTIPTNSEGKCSNATLAEVSTTTLKVGNGSVDAFDFDTDFFDFVNDLNVYHGQTSVYKIKVDSPYNSTTQSITYHYEFVNEDDLGYGTPIDGTVYFYLKYLGTTSTFYLYTKLEKDSIVYSIKPTTGVLSITEKISDTSISEEIIDIDGFSARDEEAITVTEDIVEIYYWDSKADSSEHAKFIIEPVSGINSSGLLTINGNSSVTIPNGVNINIEGTATISKLVAQSYFRTGELIIIKVGGTESTYITIIRSSDISGKFVTPYAFELSKDNITIPNSLITENASESESLRSRTYTRFLYRDEDNELLSAYLTSIEFIGLEASDITLYLVYGDNTISYSSAFNTDNAPLHDYTACYFTALKKDGALLFTLKTTDDASITGIKSLSISGIEAGNDAAGYYLEVYPLVIGKLVSGSMYVPTDDVYIRVHQYTADIDTIIDDADWESEGITVTRKGIGNDAGLSSDLDDISKITDVNFAEVSTITYILTVDKYKWSYESVTLINDTKIYDVDLGNNDTIIIDDDSNDGSIQSASICLAKLMDNGDELSYSNCVVSLSDEFDSILQLKVFEDSEKDSGKSVNVSNSDLSIALKRAGTYAGKTNKLPGVSGLITYKFYLSDKLVKTIYQRVKILDISDGISYRLNVTPSTVPLNNGGTISLLSNTTTLDFNITYTICDGKVNPTEITNTSVTALPASPTKGDLWISCNKANSKTINVSLIVANDPLTYTLKLYNGSTWNTVDTETIGYTLVGATGAANGNIQMSNDSAVIDDNSPENVLKTITDNTCKFIVGNTTITKNVKWIITLNGDIAEYCSIVRNNSAWSACPTLQFTAPSVETALHFKAKEHQENGLTDTASYGYVKYEAEYTDDTGKVYSDTKVLSIRVANISSGASYKLIVWPNVLQMDYSGTLETPSFKFKLLEITKGTTGINPSGVDLSNYNITYTKPGGNSVTFYNLPTLDTDSFIYTQTLSTNDFHRIADGLIISIVLKPQELDEVTLTVNGTEFTAKKSNAITNYKLVNCYLDSNESGNYLGQVVLYRTGSFGDSTLVCATRELYLIFDTSYATITLLDSTDGANYISITQLGTETDDSTVTISWWHIYTLDSKLYGADSSTSGIFTLSNIYLPEVYTIDSETIGIAKAGEPAASNGLAITIDNDSFLLDDDSLDAAIAGASTITPTVYYNGKLLKAATDYTYGLSLEYYSSNSSPITNQLVVDDTNYCLKRYTNYSNKLAEGYGKITCAITTTSTFNTANNLSSALTGTKSSSFYVEDFNNGETYRIIATPSTISRESSTSTVKISVTLYVNSLNGASATLSTVDPTSSPTNCAGNIYIRYYASDSSNNILGESYNSSGSISNNVWAVSLNTLSNAVGYIFEVYTYSKKGTLFVLDSETVDFSTKGDQGNSGGVYRYLGNYDDVTAAQLVLSNNVSYFSDGTIKDPTTGQYYIDVVRAATGSIYTFYECIKNYPYTDKSKYMPSSSTTYWRKYENYEGLLTHTLFVYDNKKNITGGFTGGTVSSDNDIVIWAGANDDGTANSYSANTANFYVTENGEVHASKFIGEGTFNLSYVVVDYKNASDYFTYVTQKYASQYLTDPVFSVDDQGFFVFNAYLAPETIILTRGFNKWVREQLEKDYDDSLTIPLYLPYAVVKPISKSKNDSSKPGWDGLGYVKYSESDSIYGFASLNSKHLTFINGSKFITDPSGNITDTDAIELTNLLVYYGMNMVADCTTTEDGKRYYNMDSSGQCFYTTTYNTYETASKLIDGTNVVEFVFGPYITIAKESDTNTAVRSSEYALEYCWLPRPTVDVSPINSDVLWQST